MTESVTWFERLVPGHSVTPLKHPRASCLSVCMVQYDEFLTYAGLRPAEYASEESVRIDYRSYVANMMAGKPYIKMVV